ncbi:MAG: NHLP family bacteriocin export ABC transporter peptidase/permease/ATPase subunit [Thermoanaerobaculia bacterium]
MEAQKQPETDEAPATPKKPQHRRVKTPTILQMEAVECGAAALAMILAYYGKIVPLEELRVACGVSRDGSKASNIMKAARKYGLVAKGYKYELDDLYVQKFPVILFWNFNHFLVLEGFGSKGKVFLKDPAQGPRVVTMEDVDASFSGVVLTFEPGPEFTKGGEKPSMGAALRRRLQGSEAALLFVFLCGVALVIPVLIVPTFARIFIDEYLVSNRAGILKSLLMGMAATAVIRMILTWLQDYYLLRLETKLALKTSSQFFHHVLRLPVSYFSQRYAGEIGGRVLINDKVAHLVSGKLATTALDCVLILFYAALMFVYDVTLTLVVMGVSALNIVAVKIVSRKRVDASRRLTQDHGKLMGTAMNGLKMIETLKATGGETEFFGRWSGYQAKALKADQTLGILGEAVGVVPPLVNTLTTTLVLLIGGLKVMNGQLTVGMLVAYQTLVASFTRPLNSFVSFGGSLQELEADMNRLDDVLRYPQDALYSREKDQEKDDRAVLKLTGHVELRNVTFGYSPLEKPLIENFNLVIKPGQRVALVGMSGSGKSTVAKVVSGLYEPWEGEVLFDGIPRKKLSQRLISNSVGLVDQDIFLFSGTVRENVSMWDSTIPTTTISRACRDAEIHEVIEAREGGYGAAVEEGGGNFSGGQRQRLEIARALSLGPTILLLDEATSALDPSTEATIDDALRRRGCTCIIIAHRLSTIRDADEIVIMDRGKIVQRGTHDGMKDVEGFYKYLIAAH